MWFMPFPLYLLHLTLKNKFTKKKEREKEKWYKQIGWWNRGECEPVWLCSGLPGKTPISNKWQVDTAEF